MVVLMSASSKNRKTKSRPHRPRGAPPESRASEAITVAWTVTVTTLVICELFCLSALVVRHFVHDAQGVRTIVGLSQFCALVLAFASLALLPVVYRVRRVPPPLPLAVFALIAAGVPLAVVLLASVGLM
jgi:hypothetical protein